MSGGPDRPGDAEVGQLHRHLAAADSLRPYLLTRYWLSFVDLYRDPILWSNVTRGIALQAVYVSVLLLAAWANFTTRDVTS